LPFISGNSLIEYTFDFMGNLKEHLKTIANQLTPESTLEDVYEQLALLADIERSEQDEMEANVYSSSEVKEKLNEWVK